MTTRQGPWLRCLDLKRTSLAARVVPMAMALVLASANGHIQAEERDSSAASQAAAGDRFFEQHVRPLLVENCTSCHGVKKQKGNLRLDSLEAILKGGESGPAIVAGKPSESLLVEAINYSGLEMPPSGKLGPEKIAILTRWIAIGAPWTRSGRTPREPIVIGPSNKLKPGPGAPDLWSLRPVRRVAVPDMPSSSDFDNGATWSRNPIDRFILRGLTDKGLAPAPEADRRALDSTRHVRPDRPAPYQ